MVKWHLSGPPLMESRAFEAFEAVREESFDP